MNTIKTTPRHAHPKFTLGSHWEDRTTGTRYLLVASDIGYIAVNLATGRQWNSASSVEKEAVLGLTFVAESSEITLSP